MRTRLNRGIRKSSRLWFSWLPKQIVVFLKRFSVGTAALTTQSLEMPSGLYFPSVTVNFNLVWLAWSTNLRHYFAPTSLLGTVTFTTYVQSVFCLSYYTRKDQRNLSISPTRYVFFNKARLWVVIEIWRPYWLWLKLLKKIWFQKSSVASYLISHSYGPQMYKWTCGKIQPGRLRYSNTINIMAFTNCSHTFCLSST